MLGYFEAGRWLLKAEKDGEKKLQAITDVTLRFEELALPHLLLSDRLRSMGRQPNLPIVGLPLPSMINRSPGSVLMPSD